MTVNRKTKDQLRNEVGEKRKQLHRLMKWAVETDEKCKNDEDRLMVYKLIIDTAKDYI